MKLDDLLKKIGKTSSNDWAIINTGCDEREDYNYHFTLKEDISIKMKYGYLTNENFVEKWANSFPDSRAVSHNLQILHDGVVLYENEIITLDGGRYILVIPPYDIDSFEYKLSHLLSETFTGGYYSENSLNSAIQRYNKIGG